MSDYTVKRIRDVEAVHGGGFLRLRAALGVTSFGMQIIELPPNFDGHPEHDHLGTGQEEVYVVLRGSGEIEVENERIPIDTETVVRVGPTARRKLYAGPQGLRVLALGGVPGEVYRPPHFTELGASDLTEELPDAELQKLMSDPHCPVEVKSGGQYVVVLSDFNQMVKQRFGEIAGMEERLDQFSNPRRRKDPTWPSWSRVRFLAGSFRETPRALTPATHAQSRPLSRGTAVS